MEIVFLDEEDSLSEKIESLTIQESIEDVVIKLSDNFTKIIDRDSLSLYDKLNWGNNGIGDRWCNKKFNYTVVYSNGKTSSNNKDKIPDTMIQEFLNQNSHQYNKKQGIIGIFVHSKNTKTSYRPIQKNIRNKILKSKCVSCGSNHNIVCDHKNELYNVINVLSLCTQSIDDFQALCNHCNLQKRQICKIEKKTNKIYYSAKNLDKFKIYPFIFPWEMKYYDIKNPLTKKDTYWYDPVEFQRKIYIYSTITYVINRCIQNKFLKKR